MSLGDMSSVSPEEDTLFVVEEGRGQDVVGQSWAKVGEGKAKAVMDEASLELLQGSKIDYTMELIGSQFKIVDNPRATSSCGCGTSFDVKA
jgi:iron-sulfur cluster assembly accessory protein